MKAITCPQDAIVTKAVLTGDVGESIFAHAAACAVCRKILQTANWMQTVARSSGRDPALPDPSLVYWRARFSEEQAKAEKSHDILEWVEIFSVAVILIGLAGWFVWDWMGIEGFLATTLKGEQLWLTAYTIPTVFAPVAAWLCLATILLIYPILADE